VVRISAGTRSPAFKSGGNSTVTAVSIPSRIFTYNEVLCRYPAGVISSPGSLVIAVATARNAAANNKTATNPNAIHFSHRRMSSPHPEAPKVSETTRITVLSIRPGMVKTLG
jgi:hypothetical protein